MKLLHRMYSIAVLLVISLSIADATTYYVNAGTGSDSNTGTASGTAFKTITHALGVAANTDIINVAAGTYSKSLGEIFPLNMVSGVTLSGTSGALATIINANGGGDSTRVFNCIGNSASTIIQGFTITGGYSVNYSTAGATARGGGMFIDGGSQTVIQNNIITGNTVRGYDFHQAGAGALNGGTCQGGGIFILSGTPTIRNNVISNNIAIGGGGQDYRGGFSDNGSAGGNAEGGGIHGGFGGATATIINNTFYGNQAIGGHGGSSNSLNAGHGGNSLSGALLAGSNTIVTNNIFSNNSAVEGQTGGGLNGSNGTATDGAMTSFTAGNLSYNLFFNNSATTNPDGGTLGSNNIMGSDPLFVSASDYHFSSTSSPAYHAGTTSGAPAGDLDGTSRGGTPSIGAFQGIDPLPVELISIGVNAKGNTIELGWKTASEVNNYGFEVERKSMSSEQQTMNTWGKIAFVEGHGTTNAPQNYSFTDAAARIGKYSYRLKQIDRDGTFIYSRSVEAQIGVAPSSFVLSQNYPNPFNPSTTIEYSLAASGRVSLRVYDVLGREVKTLVNERQESGTYSVRLDGSTLPSGIYYYSLNAGAPIATKKMLLLK